MLSGEVFLVNTQRQQLWIYYEEDESTPPSIGVIIWSFVVDCDRGLDRIFETVLRREHAGKEEMKVDS